MLLRLLVLVSLLCAGLPALAQNPTSSSAQPAPVAKDPRSRAKVHTELGALYYQAGRLAVAMEELTIAIAIDPDYAPAYMTRALVHHALKETTYAENNFREAFRLTPDDPELANNYGWFLCQTGHEKEGITYLMRALRNPLYETPDRAYLNAGICAVKIGDFAAAADYYDNASRLTGGSLVVLLRQADLNYRRGDYELAKRQLGDVMQRAEANAEVLWLATRIERRLGERAAEADYASQLRRQFPASREAEELLKGNYE